MAHNSDRASYISLTAWATPSSVEEDAMKRSPVGRLRIVIPHGRGERQIVVEVTLEECLALCANAADAARLLAPWRTTTR